MWRAHAKDGIVVIGVALDSAENAHAFVKQHGLTYPVVIDDDYALAQAFGIAALPFNAVVGADGKLTFAEVGHDVDALKERALAEARKKKKADAVAPPARKSGDPER